MDKSKFWTKKKWEKLCEQSNFYLIENKQTSRQINKQTDKQMWINFPKKWKSHEVFAVVRKNFSKKNPKLHLKVKLATKAPSWAHRPRILFNKIK